jgi:hypothetical protein
VTRAVFSAPRPTRVENYIDDATNLHTGTRQLVDDIYRLSPILDGRLIENETLAAYEANDMPHKLGRELRGWLVVKDTAPLCSARAYRSAALSISDITNTEIVVDTSSYDAGSDFNLATGRFTAPATGVYSVRGQVSFASLADTEEMRCYLAKNGTLVTRGDRTAIGNGTAVDLNVADMLRLDAGDYLSIWVWYNGASGTEALTVGPESNFLAVDLCRDMFDGQDDEDVDASTTLRLYSDCERTVSLWVF